MINICHDIETLGLAPGCVIRSLGAVAFDPVDTAIEPPAGRFLGSFYAVIDRASCEAVGLTVNPETEAWWNEPEQAEAKAAFDAQPGRPLSEVLDAFDEWYRAWAPVDDNADRLWSNGPSFDEAILAAAYAVCGRKPPWRYNAGRDCRTIYDLAGLKLSHSEGVFHHALDDAREQALLIQRAYRKLGLAG